MITIDIDEEIGVWGLGYVGLSVAVAFAEYADVIGLDIENQRVRELAEGFDRNDEHEAADLEPIEFTTSPTDLSAVDLHIVCVPTPVRDGNVDTGPLLDATKTIGPLLRGRDLGMRPLVVFESTVPPGCTEELCIPSLEASSGLEVGMDFGVGYSPERINPGDQEHQFANVAKVVSGSDPEAAERICSLYETVIQETVHVAASIRVAETTKIIENVQRDVNIALMNELSRVCRSQGIKTSDVLEAASTKWNFHDEYHPGLVGGHCIPYAAHYLQAGFRKDEGLPLSNAARRVNEGVPSDIAREVRDFLESSSAAHSRVLVLGLAFKPDVPNTRESKSLTLVRELEAQDLQVLAEDPVVPVDSVPDEVSLTERPLERETQVLILSVPHTTLVRRGTKSLTDPLQEGGLVYDIYGVLPEAEIRAEGYRYRTL